MDAQLSAQLTVAAKVLGTITVCIILFVIAWDVTVLVKGGTQTVSRLFYQWDVDSHWLIAAISLAIWAHIFIGERFGR